MCVRPPALPLAGDDPPCQTVRGLHVDVQLRQVSRDRLGFTPARAPSRNSTQHTEDRQRNPTTRARELSLGRPGRGDPPETCAPGRASHASLASTPRASSGRVDFGLGRRRWSGPCSFPRAADSGAGRAWRGTDTESSGGSGRHSGGPPSNRPENCRVSTNRVAVHGLHWPFFALPPLRAPPSIRPATTACPPSPTCTCWCCTTTRCMPLVFSFCSVRHPD